MNTNICVHEDIHLTGTGDNSNSVSLESLYSFVWEEGLLKMPKFKQNFVVYCWVTQGWYILLNPEKKM